ncbi:hypothetical protein [Chelativorans xinjiangense]|uniref:hypothetical protein n=1 Tax=Chelativorans xinjiangense TaxID=2681485 RepID=UPI00135BF95B|nr:hypothetical protein [Chelativorans xinjiangense]
MSTISEQLRQEASIPEKGYPLLGEAADTIDALVAALEAARKQIVSDGPFEPVIEQIDAALALARKGSGER